MNKKLISEKCLPMRMPTISTLSIVTGLDYWNAPEWFWEICLFIVALSWISYVCQIASSEPINIFE